MLYSYVYYVHVFGLFVCFDCFPLRFLFADLKIMYWEGNCEFCVDDLPAFVP